MQDIILSVGHNVNDVPTHSTADVLEALRWAIDPDGYTAYAVRGAWRGVAEDSTRIELLGLDTAEAARVLEAVPELCRLLNQEAIAVTVTPSHTRFVSATA